MKISVHEAEKLSLEPSSASIGFGHIRAAHAEPIQRFYAEHLNPYLNFHRPRAQADPEIDCQRTHPSKLQALPDHV
jgi:hypothetical protein